MSTPSSIHTVEISPEIRVHAIPTGNLAVKPLHRDYTGPAFLRFPRIFFSSQWTEMIPVWTWLIETPEGRFLIDSGECPAFNDDAHFGKDKRSLWLHRKIMRVKMAEQSRIDARLADLGLSPKDLDAVLLTHLHIDHTDGLKYLAGPEVMVGKREWEKQWGTAPGTWPSGLKPTLLTYQKAEHPFGAELQLAKHLRVVPTPGHTHGHQSVLLDHEGTTYMFAGDTSFTQQGLLDGKTPGINIDFKTAAKTRLRILEYATVGKLVYLPSHDPDAPERLQRRIMMRI